MTQKLAFLARQTRGDFRAARNSKFRIIFGILTRRLIMAFFSEPGVFSKNFCSLEHLRKQWNWFLALGIILMVLGILAIGASTIATVASMVFLGALLLIGGAVQIGYTFTIREWSGFFLSLLSGILYAVVGFFLVVHPTAGALSLTLLLAAFYIVGGIFRIIGAATMQFEQWGWALFSGIIKLALGLLIWVGWPATGLWVFGLFIGIDLLFYGWFWVLLSLTARNMIKR